MSTVAIYSMKGGVGKTMLAVNLAWLSASQSRRRTLLWDLDAQAAASFILGGDRASAVPARAVIEQQSPPATRIVRTGVDGLDLLPADASLRSLDALFNDLDKRKRLLKLADALARDYDRVILDCPPGLGLTTDQIIRSAALIVLPVVPSGLSERTLDEVRDHLGRRHKGRPALLPVFTMVDRRRSVHRAMLDAHPDRPVIPAASVAERMDEQRAAIGSYAPRSPVAKAAAEVWADVERRLAR